MILNRLLAGLLFALFSTYQAQAATTLLPPPKQCFNNANGPLASGTVATYIPNTLTPKATWQDSGQSVLNTSTITLDINGCALIYGVGSYRFIVSDSLANQVYDQVTTDTSAFNAVFWAATAGGTPNVITVVNPGFNGTDGSVIQFVALATNTGSATLNPSGFGNVLIQKATTAGPVSLSGGEIIQGNTISAVYIASSNSFQLLSSVIQSASGAIAPLCGATGLKITNGSSPSTIINLTADQVVLQTSAGITINRSNVSLAAINITTGNTTATANGMDGELPGISQALYVWVIDNGAAPAGLISTSSTAPTMPSGYSYKCRMGAMLIDGSGNLLRTVQAGKDTQYVITATSNTTIPPVMTSGIAGTYSNTSPVLVAVNVSSFVPPTAMKITVLLGASWKGGAISSTLLAPNAGYGGTNNGPRGTNGLVWPIANLGEIDSITTSLLLESSSIYWASSTAGGALACLGWTDKINAN